MQDVNDSPKPAKRSSAKKIVVASFYIFIGFVLHAVFFPEIVPETVMNMARPAAGPTDQPQQKNEAIIKYAVYKNGAFTPPTIRIHFGNYVAIRNDSKDELMWLQSTDLPSLSTERGFGQSEQLQVVMIKEGTFRVFNKLEPRAQLTVIVKK